MLQTIKKLLFIPIVIMTLAVGWALSATVASADDSGNEVVGAWEVTADAPYPPHLFTFNADHTMLSTNPTNVQENPSAPHGGTNDSVGMGSWGVENHEGTKYIVGTFEELNALADNHQPTDTLSVSFKVKVSGDSFDGPATVKVGGVTVASSHLTGTARVSIDQDAVDTLPNN